MSAKIQSLTPEQKARLPEFRDKWIQIGLSCEPLDLERAKRGVALAYQAAGLKPPSRFIVCDSPIHAAKVAAELKDKGKSVENSVRDSVRHSVWNSVGNSVWLSVGDSVRHSVGDSVWDSVENSVWNSVNEMSYGSHDSHWLACYDYCHKVLGIKECEKLEGLWEIAKSCGWWTPYENVAILQHRHSVLKLDPEGRLHCENGPAVKYRDGFSVYAWRGTRIPEDWIEDKNSITPQTALTWGNIEQRRVAAEIIGWDKVIQQLSPKIIDKDQDPMIGELLEVELPGMGRERFLKVLCGTGRTFALPVPPEMTTALEANAWTYGVDGNILRSLEVRT